MGSWAATHPQRLGSVVLTLPREEQVEPGQVEEIDLQGGKITLKKGQRVTCTIINTRDLGSLTITKEFNAQTSGFKPGRSTSPTPVWMVPTR